MSAKLPAWLEVARSKAPAVPGREPRNRPVWAGDIRTIAHMDGKGRKVHCIVLAADVEAGDYEPPIRRAALVMLATGALEGATPLDMTLPASDLGLTYALLARTDIVGPVLTTQLEGQFIGSVLPGDLEILQRAALDGASSLPRERVGLPVRSPRDIRLVEKRTDLERFLEVTATARTDLSEPPVVIDLGTEDTAVVAAVVDRGIVNVGEAERTLSVAEGLGLGIDAQALLEAPQLAAVVEGQSIPHASPRGRLTWSPGRPSEVQQIEMIEDMLRRFDFARRTLVVFGPGEFSSVALEVEDENELRRQVILIGDQAD